MIIFQNIVKLNNKYISAKQEYDYQLIELISGLRDEFNKLIKKYNLSETGLQIGPPVYTQAISFLPENRISIRICLVALERNDFIHSFLEPYNPKLKDYFGSNLETILDFIIDVDENIETYNITRDFILYENNNKGYKNYIDFIEKQIGKCIGSKLLHTIEYLIKNLKSYSEKLKLEIIVDKF